MGADTNPKEVQPRKLAKTIKPSPALSMANTRKDTIKSRKVAILAADGVDEASIANMKKALTAAGALAKVVAPRLGTLQGAGGGAVPVDISLLTCASVLFDAVYVPGGDNSADTLAGNADAIHFVNEAYKHCKAIAVSGAGVALFRASSIGIDDGAEGAVADGVIVAGDGDQRRMTTAFIDAIAQHRFWSREEKEGVPA